jgi:hypothetical protein
MTAARSRQDPLAGRRARILKGASVDGVPAGRTYTVTVHHSLGGHPGWCCCVAGPWIDRPEGHSKHCSRPVPLSIRWAGTGGYWRAAALDAVELLPPDTEPDTAN